MRPFWHPRAVKIDDEDYCVTLPDEQPLLLAIFILLAAMTCLSSAAFTTTLYIPQLNTPIQWTNELIIALSLIVALVICSVLLLVFFTRIMRSRHFTLNRKNRNTTVPGPTLIPTLYSDKYENFQGMILHEKNLFGRRRARLVLQHLPSGQLISLYTTYDTPQTLAGYWSFIVQYMKPGAQLPDVPALHHYPNTTPGVRPHPTIDYS